jgi:DNA-binding NtrC family response regulator
MQQGVIISGLYEIMHAMPLEIPALQKRSNDIPFLVDHYLTVLKSEKYEKISIESLALRALCNHEWKKNITELELVIKQCIADSFLYDGLITLSIVQKYLLRVDTTLIEEQLYYQYVSFDEAVLSFEKKFLLYHLKKNRYDLEKVSHKTKLNVLQLQNKLAALDIVLKK